ncbi:MAG: phosphate acyltransferase [Coriobacteriia bacterium]|nr:phosphate acyltransferase [Coriobacteriia bacterium]
MAVMDALIANAKKKKAHIVFPEGHDPRVVKAAKKLEREGIAHPIVLEEKDLTAKKISKYAHAFTDLTELPIEILEMMLAEPLNFAAAMVAAGDADGMVAGLDCATQDVIMSSQLFIKILDNISLPSSFFIMELDDPKFGEDGCLVFADCAVVVQPTFDELADIAITTADSVKHLLGWEPRVALLSFSTKGSAGHEEVKKVIKALDKVQTNRLDIKIDGEFQADTALDPKVARTKIEVDSEVAGKANVLIFPDLDAGNTGYKLVQRLAGAKAYGPVLQGFRHPVSDLSRGATVDDIVGAAVVVAAQVNKEAM